MTDDYLTQKKFLEAQLQWCRDRDEILAEIEGKLYEMRSIAEYALEHKLSSAETTRLNGQLGELQGEVLALEKQLDAVGH